MTEDFLYRVKSYFQINVIAPHFLQLQICFSTPIGEYLQSTLKYSMINLEWKHFARSIKSRLNVLFLKNACILDFSNGSSRPLLREAHNLLYMIIDCIARKKDKRKCVF